MPRSRLIWLEVADRQYHDLPDRLRALVVQRLAQLAEDATSDPDADYNERLDQWSLPLGDEGFLFYAVVRDPPTVIVLRVVSFV